MEPALGISRCPLVQLALEVKYPLPRHQRLRERSARVHRRPPPVQSCCVLTGPLRHVPGFPRAGLGRGAVLALPPVRFPDPPSEPDLPIPEHPALHRTCAGRLRGCVRHWMVPRSPGGAGQLGSTASGFGVRGIGSGSPAPRLASRAWCPLCSSICVPSTAV